MGFDLESDLGAGPAGRLRPSTKLRPLELALLRDLEAWRGKRLLVACSGGADSLALAHALSRVSARLEIDVRLAHVHHGRGPAHRDAAEACVRAFARARGLRLHVARYALGARPLTREAELRRLRHRALQRLIRLEEADVVVLAHHADDLFETRLIRLARGTGPEGLRAMQTSKGKLLRPWLNLPRAKILAYAREENLTWNEDPTNADSRHFRNWIRNEWLPLLEKKRPGATKAFARSLENLTSRSPQPTPPTHQLTRESYFALSSTARTEWLIKTARALGAKNFGTSHVGEIRKRIESSRELYQTVKMRSITLAISQQKIEMRRNGLATPAEPEKAPVP